MIYFEKGGVWIQIGYVKRTWKTITQTPWILKVVPTTLLPQTYTSCPALNYLETFAETSKAGKHFENSWTKPNFINFEEEQPNFINFEEVSNC